MTREQLAVELRACESCGIVLAPEPGRRGPIRKLCRSCAAPAEYQRRWLAHRPDYRPTYNAARRLAPLPPRACPGCLGEFVPRRVDQRHCCSDCGYQTRTYGPYTPEGAAAHRVTHAGGARSS
jgi:hypothetical protein